MENKPRELALLLYSVSHTDKRFLSAKEIVFAMSLKDDRQLRAIKEEALRIGYPISSNTANGYYWTTNQDLPKIQEKKMHALTELVNANKEESNFFDWKNHTTIHFTESNL